MKTNNEPAKSKPPFKLTLGQKWRQWRRLKDVNAQLRKELAEMDDEYSAMLDAEKKRYEDLAAWKIPAFVGLDKPLTEEQYQSFVALLKDLDQTRMMMSKQLSHLCRKAIDITYKLPEPISRKDAPPLYWLNRLVHLHPDGMMYYCSGAFETIDRLVRQCRAGVEFVHSLQGPQPEAADVVKALEEKAAIMAKYEAERFLPENPSFRFRDTSEES